MNKLLLMALVLGSNVANALIQEADTKQQADSYDEQINQVIYIDHDLNRHELGNRLRPDRKVVKITTEKTGSRLTETGTLKAWAVMKNRTDYDLQVEARITFIDQDQIPLDDVTSWTRLYLPANSVSTYRESSLSFEARYYMIEIREGR